MRIDWNRKYTTIAVYVFLTAAALICFLSAILYRESIGAFFVKILTVLKPVLYGVAIAYLLSPLERRFHDMFDRLFEKSRGKHKGKIAKMLGIVLTYIVFLILLTGFIFLVIPGIGKVLRILPQSCRIFTRSAWNSFPAPIFPFWIFRKPKKN